MGLLTHFLRSDARWNAVRAKNVGTECRMCGDSKHLEVHHIIPWEVCHTGRYDPDNLITLCRECHFRFGHFRDWKDWNPKIRVLCRISNEIRSCSKISVDQGL